MVIVDLQYVEVTEESMVEGGYAIADAIASASAVSGNLFGSATTFTSNTTSAVSLPGLSAATSSGSSNSSAF